MSRCIIRRHDWSQFSIIRLVSCGFKKLANGKLRGGGARGDEFVFFDFGGDAGSALLVGLDAHHMAVAANVHIASGNYLRRKRQDKINLVALFKRRLSDK